MQAGSFVCELDCEEWGSLGAVIPIKKAPLHSVNTSIHSKEGENRFSSLLFAFHTERPCINGNPNIPALPEDDNVNSS